MNLWSHGLRKRGDYNKSIKKAKQILEKIKLYKIKSNNILTSVYNNLGTCAFYKGEYDNAIFFHKKGLDISYKYLEKKEEYLLSTYGNIGLCFWYKRQYDQSLFFSKKALSYIKYLDKANPVYLSTLYGNIGLCYSSKGRYNDAIALHKKALKNNLDNELLISENSALHYQSIGSCFLKMGDYNNAFSFVKRALNIYKDVSYKTHKSIINANLLLGNCFLRMQEYEKAITIFLQNIANCSALSKYEKNTFLLKNYCHLSKAYFEKRNYDLSINFSKKSLDNIIYKQPINIQWHIMSYFYLGECFTAKKDHRIAIQYKKKALNTCKLLNITNGIKEKCYLSLANSYKAVKSYYKSLQLYSKAISNYFIKYPNTSIYKNPTTTKKIFNEFLLDIFLQKSTTFHLLYKEKQQLKDLQSALFTTQAAATWIPYIRKSFSAEGSQLHLAKQAYPIYLNGIKIALYTASIIEKNPIKWVLATDEIATINLDSFPKESFHYCYTKTNCWTTAFDFYEQSRAMVLLGNMQDEKAKFKAKIPEDLLEKERDLKLELTYLTKRIQEEEYKAKTEQDEAQIRIWQNARFDQSQAYEALIERLEKDYPEYHYIKYNVTSASLTEVQVQLTNEQALIEYAIDEENKQIYIFGISKTSYIPLVIEQPDDFKALIEDFLTAINTVDKEDYITLAYELYQLLLAPVFNHLPIITELIIIPDDDLSLIPFEALLTQSIADDNPYNDLPYLLLDYDISYHYSATLWHRGMQQKRQGIYIENNFIGFAPVYESNLADSLTRNSRDQQLTEDHTRSVEIRGEKYKVLKYSEEEVKNIKAIFESKNYHAEIQLHESASIDNFKEKVKQYKYVLIAAHADYQQDKPELSGIIFSPPETLPISESDTNKTEADKIMEELFASPKAKDTTLSLADVYHLQLNADLVVLSCCETGIGQQFKGEGMMGINRGFLYSGAKNIVYTLFKVYDKVSGELTTQLFHHILAGHSYVKALRLAKLDLLKREDIDPRCWAGYVLLS